MSKPDCVQPYPNDFIMTLKKGRVSLDFVESTTQWNVKLLGGEISMSDSQNREEAQNLIDLLESYLLITKSNYKGTL